MIWPSSLLPDISSDYNLHLPGGSYIFADIGEDVYQDLMVYTTAGFIQIYTNGSVRGGNNTLTHGL